jgi:Uma2 family endonuclease
MDERSTVDAMAEPALPEPQLDGSPITYDEWLAWPDTNLPVEVVDGQPIMSPAPARLHQRAVSRLLQVLAEAAPAHLEVLASPLDWVLRREPLLVRQPDLVVVDADPDPPAHLVAAPLMAVEVVSPNSRERDLVHKRQEYSGAGLPWLWLVDLEVPQILVLRGDGERFATYASARGHDLLHVTEPFAVRVRPRDLR